MQKFKVTLIKEREFIVVASSAEAASDVAFIQADMDHMLWEDPVDKIIVEPMD